MEGRHGAEGDRAGGEGRLPAGWKGRRAGPVVEKAAFRGVRESHFTPEEMNDFGRIPEKEEDGEEKGGGDLHRHPEPETGFFQWWLPWGPIIMPPITFFTGASTPTWEPSEK